MHANKGNLMKIIILITLSFSVISSFSQIATFSGAYGLTGVGLDQPEIVLNIETTYKATLSP